MRGLVPRIHAFILCRDKAWMAGTRPAMTKNGLESLRRRLDRALAPLRVALKEPVLRPRQTEILAQRPALVFAAIDAAPLQLRHDLVDEVVEPAGQIREGDV